MTRIKPIVLADQQENPPRESFKKGVAIAIEKCEGLSDGCRKCWPKWQWVGAVWIDRRADKDKRVHVRQLGCHFQCQGCAEAMAHQRSALKRDMRMKAPCLFKVYNQRRRCCTWCAG